jgi:hypothetical protein
MPPDERAKKHYRSFNKEKNTMAVIDPAEVSRLQAYLQNKFGHNGIALKIRDKANDSVEVIMNGEFIGLIYKDDEDGEVSYDFQMAILEMDLPAAA